MNRMLFRLPRRLTIPAAFGAALTLAMLTYPGGLSAAYSDFEHYDEHTRQLESKRSTDSHYDASFLNVMDRINTKEQWLGELIESRASLRTTTQRFMGLNRSNDTARTTIETYYTGATYEEKAARNVIDFAKARLQHTPGPSDTRQRLRTEFRAMFGTTVAMD